MRELIGASGKRKSQEGLLEQRPKLALAHSKACTGMESMGRGTEKHPHPE